MAILHVTEKDQIVKIGKPAAWGILFRKKGEIPKIPKYRKRPNGQKVQMHEMPNLPPGEYEHYGKFARK